MLDHTIITHSERNLLIDNYRGWVIFIVFVWCCIFLHLNLDDCPLIVFHTDNWGLDVAFGIMDYGMTFFILASGMTFKLVFEKRKKANGLSAAYLHSVKRAFGVMGVGMVELFLKDIGGPFSSDKIEILYGWEVFASIGFALLFATLFIDLSKTMRLLIGYIIILCYSIGYQYVPFISLTAKSEGMAYCGPMCAIACSGLILIFSVVGELLISKEYYFFFSYYIVSVISSIPSFIFTYYCGENYSPNPDFGIWGNLFSISFSRARPGYLIAAIPISLTALIIIWAITEVLKRPIILLADMGKNTLIFFLTFTLTFLLTGYIGSFIESLWLDICMSIFVSITVCVILNQIIKKTGFSFTV